MEGNLFIKSWSWKKAQYVSDGWSARRQIIESQNDTHGKNSWRSWKKETMSLRKNEGHPSRLEGKFEGKVRILRESLREYLGAIFKVWGQNGANLFFLHLELSLSFTYSLYLQQSRVVHAILSTHHLISHSHKTLTICHWSKPIYIKSLNTNQHDR